MATLPEIRDQANGLLAVIAPRIVQAQITHYRAYGRYWQGAFTHPAPPEDGLPVIGDALRRVSDEVLSWADLRILDRVIDLPFRLAINVYGEGEQSGYVIIAQAKFDGVLYQRSYAAGWRWQDRTHDWRSIDDGIT
jgi:hypothetical protein